MFLRVSVPALHYRVSALVSVRKSWRKARESLIYQNSSHSNIVYPLAILMLLPYSNPNTLLLSFVLDVSAMKKFVEFNL